MNLQTVLSDDQESAIDLICAIDWSELDEVELTGVALAYHYFSIQFRENLQIACAGNPQDTLLAQLAKEECATDNLSPWPGVANTGEAMDHDEFMRRLLDLSPIPPGLINPLQQGGEVYLSRIRGVDPAIRAASIPSYEDGGLERLFRAILRCPNWTTPLLKAFRHFLERHIDFDSDPRHGHGSLARHLKADTGVDALWDEFRRLLTTIPGINAQRPAKIAS